MTNSSSELFVETQTFCLPQLGNIALSGDGQKIVGSLNKQPSVGIWDFKTGKRLQTITEEDSVFFIDIDPGGEIAFSVWQDGTVKAWNIHTRQVLCQFQGSSRYHGSYTISRNQQTIVGRGCDYCLIKAWNAQTGREIFSHLKPKAVLVSNAITQDGQILITGTSSIEYGGMIQIWDLSTGRECQSIIASIHQGSKGEYSCSWGVGRLILTEDESLLLAGMNDGKVQVYSFPSGQYVRTIRLPNRSQRTRQAPRIAISSDKRTLFAKDEGYSPRDDTIRIWDFLTGELKNELKLPYFGIWNLAVSPDNRYLLCHATTQIGGVIEVWDWQKQQMLHTSAGHGDFVFGVAMVSHKDEAISASRDKTVKVWDIKTGQNRLTFKGHLAQVKSLVVSSDSQSVLSGDINGVTHIWNLHNGKLIRTLEGLSQWGSIAISPDGKTIAGSGLASNGGILNRINLWQWRTGKLIHTINSHVKSLDYLVFNPNGRTLVSSADTIKVWDLKTYQEILNIPASGLIAISPDGHLLISCSGKALNIWNLQTGQKLHTFPVKKMKASAMAISPDFCMVALGYNTPTNNLQLWELQNGKLIGSLTGHIKEVSCLAFNANSQTLVSGSHDGSVRVWQRAAFQGTAKASPKHFAAPQIDRTQAPTKVRELTPEQKASLNKISDRWFQVQASTQTDRPQVEAALHLAYQEAHLAPPSEIIWQPNPITGMRAYINALQLDQRIEQGVGQGLTAAINAVLKPVLEKKLVQKALQMHLERNVASPIINKVIIPAVGKAVEDVVTPRAKKSGLALSVSAAIAEVQKKLCTQEFKIAIQEDIQQRMDSQFSRDLAKLISKSKINNTYNASFRSVFHNQGLNNINPTVSQSLLSAPWNSNTLLVHSQIEQSLLDATRFQKEHLTYSVKQLIEAEIGKATRKVIMLNGKLLGFGSEGLLLQMGDELKEAIAKSLEKFETKIPENWSKGVVEDAITTITPVVMDYGQSESLKQYFSSSIKKQLRGSARQACLWLMNQYVPKINNSNSIKYGSFFGWETFGIVAKGLANFGIKEVQRRVCEKFGKGFAEAVEPFILEAIWSAWQDYSPNAITDGITQAFQISLRPDLEKVVQMTAVQVSKDLHQSLEDNVFCSYNLAPTFAWDQFCHEVGWQKEQSQQGLAQTTKQLSWWWPLRDRVIAVPRPQTLELDSQNRLHGEGKVAIAWEGFQLYGYHGVELPPQYGELSPTQWQSAWVKTEKSVRLRQILMEGIGFTRLCEEIDIADLFLQERNTGLRHFLIQGIGYGRLLDKLGSQVLDKWREYTLLRIDHNIDVEKVYLLKMTCPSTNHIHVIRVPPNTTSARAGATWVNWGIDPEEFIAET